MNLQILIFKALAWATGAEGADCYVAIGGSAYDNKQPYECWMREN